MYVRMFMSAIDPDDLEPLGAIFRDDVKPALLSQPGCESVELVANVTRNAGGLVEGAAISRWRTMEDLERALDQREVQESIVRARQILRQEPVTKTFEVLEG
ncbi:MAG: antibiotic biosynthesis monooxygenase [Actinobacteria bacterium]|nr:antibiotic biosynthesis monooxygenase [Actinomycetota bacterium]